MSRTLVCSLGGSPGPIMASVASLRPDRVLFCASKESATQIQGILASLKHTPTTETVIVPDEQDLGGCLAVLRSAIAGHPDWHGMAERGCLYVDFTGGTKVMVAAVAMAFSDMPVIFRYVGGTSRSKGGLGIVETGTELILCQRNPLLPSERTPRGTAT